MGRGEELSDFQRGMVVGCHLCHKSVREVSALLELPRSTVSAVILRWKRSGVTTALPRSGRPHKLREEDRRLLEQVARGHGAPSVEALTADFQSASGARVSSRTVRRELHHLGLTGRVSTYGKAAGGQTSEGKQADRDEARADVSCLDLRVGRVITTLQDPERDGVYVQQVDVGEAAPRTVVSQLAQHIPVDQMQNRLAVVLCNLKPAKTSGVLSQALMLCASSPDKVELLDPPIGAAPGDRVTVQGFPGEGDKELNPKEKVWERLQTDLCTDNQGVATYRGAAFEVRGKGVCRAQTLTDAEIK